MSPKTHIFVTGATALFNSLGVTAVVGTNSDFDVLISLASEADVVLSCANVNDINAARAVLLGLKKRYEQTKTVPIFIHTSGTGVLIDNAVGNYATDKIYSDLDVPIIESLLETQPHRDVDLEVIAADKQGYVRTYVILPSTIYGIANTLLVSLGVQNPYSIQIPDLIKAGLDRKQGGVIGKGLNLWSSIHIDDVATLYISVFDAAMKGQNETGHGSEGYYFGENGEYRMGEISEVLAKLLYEMKRGESPEPTVFTDEEVQKYFGGPSLMGTNSRARAERAKLIGWNPVHTIDSLWASLKPEIETIVKRQNA
ncbi:uncharacterized protein EDB91DRAFT_1157511 [Suillus paluster]|uniref:uncharacterized protein n=1 Tax=Suillus paluster TaxID=48578 RepID=UPI001B86E1CB|nr:uncharacterized protein EDB91DRAFT_1157511 [Suillus paluster]KAG1730246.1 hypothetical protein EDB91DRAFT_1157511 [Suillus paluster]